MQPVFDRMQNSTYKITCGQNSKSIKSHLTTSDGEFLRNENHARSANFFSTFGVRIRKRKSSTWFDGIRKLLLDNHTNDWKIGYTQLPTTCMRNFKFDDLIF